MTRRAHIHPHLARKVADYLSDRLWGGQFMEQVHPGLFVHEGKVLAVIGAAPISEPAENALRRCGLLSELAALQDAAGDVVFYGPRLHHSDDEWGDLLGSCYAASRDVQTVFSKFEVAIAFDRTKIACLQEASALVAAALPESLQVDVEERRYLIEEVGGWGFLPLLEEEISKAVEAA